MAFLDQMIFRFSRLQDSIGNKLITVGLLLLGEPAEEMTMLDKLHRLEKLGVIQDTDRWLNLRELRNEFTHEYPEEDLIRSDALNLLRTETTYLKETYQKFIDFVKSKT